MHLQQPVCIGHPPAHATGVTLVTIVSMPRVRSGPLRVVGPQSPTRSCCIGFSVEAKLLRCGPLKFSEPFPTNWRGRQANSPLLTGGCGFRELGQLHANSASAIFVFNRRSVLGVLPATPSLQSLLPPLAFLASEVVDRPRMLWVLFKPLIRKVGVQFITGDRLTGRDLSKGFTIAVAR